MANAKDVDIPAGKAILILGDTGSGKTTQLLTLPGKKFVYVFDPNALSSLQGHDVDYETFLPDRLQLKLVSLKAGVNPSGPVQKNKGVEVYKEWENHFEKALSSGFFDSYDTIGLDSGTTFLDMIMDGVLAINGRGGMWPQQDDYGPQMLAFTQVMRTLTSLGKRVYVTGHTEYIKDEIINRVFNVPMMTGRLKKKIPLLFSEVLHAEAVNDGKGTVKYMIQTKPDRLNPTIRTSLKGLDPFIDVTIDFNKPIEGQGLGGFILRATKK